MQASVWSTLLVIVIVIGIFWKTTQPSDNEESFSRQYRKPTKWRKHPSPSWNNRHLNDTGLGAYGLGGTNGNIGGGYHPRPLQAAAKYKSRKNADTYFWKPHAREMYAGGAGRQISVTGVPEGSTPQTNADWLVANAQARAAGVPRPTPHSQFVAPVVSSLDPHNLQQNPLDPFLNDILFQVSTYRNNRNNNFDLRGQPYVDPDFLKGQDQLVNVRATERLAYHGKSHQVTDCTAQQPPRY